MVEAPYTSFFLVRLKEDRKLIKGLPGVEKYEVSSTDQGNQILDSLANVLAGIMRNINLLLRDNARSGSAIFKVRYLP